MPALPQEYVELCAKEAKVTYFMDNLPLPAKKIALLSQHKFGNSCSTGCVNLLIYGYTHVQIEIHRPRPSTYTDSPGIYQYSFRKIGDPLCRGFEKYINNNVKAEYRPLRLGLVDRCIATERIDKFDADVIHRFNNEDIIVRDDYVIEQNQLIIERKADDMLKTILVENNYAVIFRRVNPNTGVGYSAACHSEGFKLMDIFKPIGHEFAFIPPGYKGIR